MILLYWILIGSSSYVAYALIVCPGLFARPKFELLLTSMFMCSGVTGLLGIHNKATLLTACGGIALFVYLKLTKEGETK